jgi:hypothetical protein
MRKALIGAGLLLAITAPNAGADPIDLQGWYRRALSAAQSIWRPHRPDREVIAPPEDLDGKMVLAPPEAGLRMPVIRPRSDR